MYIIQECESLFEPRNHNVACTILESTAISFCEQANKLLADFSEKWATRLSEIDSDDDTWVDGKIESTLEFDADAKMINDYFEKFNIQYDLEELVFMMLDGTTFKYEKIGCIDE